MYCCTT